ncbi:MAG: ubiquinone biosynthesis protein UbiA [Methanobacteriota archaeon]|nr:MAG: ubiquinone biosynthesis protein UbiA [Euryarchaeota archaeon]
MGGSIEAHWERIKPFLEILKLKGSLVDVSTILAVSAFLGRRDWRLIWAMLSCILIHSGGDIYNDIYDREIDQVCKPLAPIPSGRMTVKAAWAYLALLLLLALSISLYLSKILFLCLVAGILTGYVFYSHPMFRFKDMPIVSIAIIAFSFSLESIGVWSLYSGITREALIVAAYIFLLVFSLVFMKDFRDVEGDINSLPLMWGVKKAAIFSSMLCILPLMIFVFLSTIYQQAIIWIAALTFISLVSSCIKILVFGDPVAQGRELKNRMILSLSMPNIVLFALSEARSWL